MVFDPVGADVLWPSAMSSTYTLWQYIDADLGFQVQSILGADGSVDGSNFQETTAQLKAQWLFTRREEA